MKKHITTLPVTPQADSPILDGVQNLSVDPTKKSCPSLRTALCTGLALLIWLIGCEPKQQIDHLKVGRQQLLNSGLAVDAIKHLKEAEIEELDKAPAARVVAPRIHTRTLNRRCESTRT